MRPNHSYPTLEFRVCDVCTRVDEAVCVAAILQAIVAKLWKLRRDNMTFRVYPTALIEENKWRAVRYGLDGKLIDFGKEQELPARTLIRGVAGVVRGRRASTSWAAGRKWSTPSPSWSRGPAPTGRSRRFRETGDLKAVVDSLVSETADGVVDSVEPVPAVRR